MILYLLFGVIWLAVIFAVSGAILVGIARMLAESFNDEMSGVRQRSGDSPGPPAFPVNAPAPPLTAAQNAFQNTHGATALNAARNSGHNP
jgi:hypothetical protein